MVSAPLPLEMEMEEEAFARAAGETIAELEPVDRREGCLTLALLLSACLHRCGLDSWLDRASLSGGKGRPAVVGAALAHLAG